MTKPTQKKSTSRTTRSRTARPRFEPNERHKQVLLLVHEHRFLSVELLWHLMLADEPRAQALGEEGQDGKRRPRQYGFGQQALYKVIQRLREAKYLEAHRLYDGPTGRGSGSTPLVYGLGSKSAGYLSEILGCPSREVQEIVQANKVKTPFLRHALEVARFRVTLELACRAPDGMVRLLFWEQGQMLRDYVHVRDTYGDEVRLSVYPDAAFALEVEGKGRAFYMLEMDRGTMPIRAKSDRSDIVKKLLAYMAYREGKRITKRYAYRTEPGGNVIGLQLRDDVHESAIRESDLVKGFNVLFVVPTGVEAHGTPSGRIANILSEMSQLGKGFSTTTLFWFTVPGAYDVARPSSLLSPVWVTVKPSLGLQSLIE